MQIEKIFRRFIDLILPRSAELRTLEEMAAEQLTVKIRRSDRGNEENIFSIFDYREPLIKTAIWQIKYRNHAKINRLLGEILYSELIDELATLSQFSNFTNPIILPTPMSEARRKARGYNQTENLAREMVKIDGGRSFNLMTDVLIKVKDTPSQSSLPRALRLKNLKNCFKVIDPAKVRGRNIVLVDDVMTTGSTIKECRDTLLRAGARKVIGMVVAH